MLKKVAGLGILAGFILTIVSFLRLCTEECEAGHKFNLLGVSFEMVGILFFVTLAIVFAASRWYSALAPWCLLLLASSLGAELVFIGYQKFVIGAWCPVCLGIAASVAVAFFALLIETYKKGNIMGKSFAAICLGFLIAFTGISEKNALSASEQSLKEGITFGKTDSNIEVYLFTDWACPACRKLEPNLEQLSNEITKEAKLTFVDHVIHPETLNFIPYHLALILSDKPDYFKIRHALTTLSEKTGSPTEEEVEAELSKIGVKYHQLDYADVAIGIKYFKELGTKFKVQGTPTLVIVNTVTKKGKKLAGTGEITEANVSKSIQTLQGS